MLKKAVCIWILGIILAYNAHACSCITLDTTLRQEIRNTKLIFVGKVLKRETVDFLIPMGWFAPDTFSKQKFYFEIMDCIKGNLPEKQQPFVFTGFGGGDCGFTFIEGNTYVVYAEINDKHYQSTPKVAPYVETNICTRTHLLENDLEIGYLKRMVKKYCFWNWLWGKII